MLNMEIVILSILLVILGETSFLSVVKLRGGALFRRASEKRRIYVDTSALMDGKLLDLARTGFLADDLVIPRSVIRELQMLADGKEANKRARARFGLDAVNELERIEFFETEILGDKLDHTPVDERLIELAKADKGKGWILTNDFNLNKVAGTEGISVLNINELVLALQNELQAGDRVKLVIDSKGSGSEQGVGHLPDGTMVVVEDAKSKIGKEINVEIMRFHQTPAGRLIFAKLVRASRKPRSRGRQ